MSSIYNKNRMKIRVENSAKNIWGVFIILFSLFACLSVYSLRNCYKNKNIESKSKNIESNQPTSVASGAEVQTRREHPLQYLNALRCVCVCVCVYACR